MKLIYHLGYPRTGTTLLQKNIFEKHQGINYLGPKYYDQDFKVKFKQKEIDEIENFIISQNKNGEIDYNQLNSKIDIKKFSEKKVNILSSEKYLSFSRYRNYAGLIALKNFLKEKSDLKLKIFYIIRNQYELIQSLYHQGYSSLKKYLECYNLEELISKIEDKNFNENENIYHFLKSYDFNYMFNIIQKSFPDAEIKIFNYNNLRDNSHEFFKNLTDFMEINFEEFIKLIPSKKENSSRLVNNTRILESEFQRVIRLNKFYQFVKPVIPNKLRAFIRDRFYKREIINFDKELSQKKVIQQFYLESNNEFQNKTGMKVIW